MKIIVLTDAGRALAAEIDEVLSVPPAAFSALSRPELRQLRDLLDKVLAATGEEHGGGRASHGGGGGSGLVTVPRWRGEVR